VASFVRSRLPREVAGKKFEGFRLRVPRRHLVVFEPPSPDRTVAGLQLGDVERMLDTRVTQEQGVAVRPLSWPYSGAAYHRESRCAIDPAQGLMDLRLPTRCECLLRLGLTHSTHDRRNSGIDATPAVDECEGSVIRQNEVRIMLGSAGLAVAFGQVRDCADQVL
jgi:hypothetical protein